MLALKKKREAEAKAKAEAAEASSGPDAPKEASSAGKISLLGVGGSKKKTGTDGNGKATGGKKRTPGEIRIQKGTRINLVIFRVDPRTFSLMVL